MRFLRVKDWRKFQHYTKRNPPWIKLHNSLLENADFAALPDQSKAHMIGIWLLASRTENRMPADADFIGRRINATSPVDMELLVSQGFLELTDDASNMLADCKQDASTVLATCKQDASAETETETETKQSRADERTGEERPVAPAPLCFAFEGQTLKITERQDEVLGEAFPWIDRQQEYAKMDSWLVANPERRIRKFPRFAHGWLSKVKQPAHGFLYSKPANPPVDPDPETERKREELAKTRCEKPCERCGGPMRNCGNGMVGCDICNFATDLDCDRVSAGASSLEKKMRLF